MALSRILGIAPSHSAKIRHPRQLSLGSRIEILPSEICEELAWRRRRDGRPRLISCHPGRYLAHSVDHQRVIVPPGGHGAAVLHRRRADATGSRLVLPGSSQKGRAELARSRARLLGQFIDAVQRAGKTLERHGKSQRLCGCIRRGAAFAMPMPVLVNAVSSTATERAVERARDI